MKTFLIAVVSIALSVAAQFSLKAGMSAVAAQGSASSHWTDMAWTIFKNQYVLLGFLLYGLGAVAWLGVLSTWDVSKAYPLVGFGFILTVVIGLLVGEQVTSLRVIGVALICAGVVMVGRS